MSKKWLVLSLILVSVGILLFRQFHSVSIGRNEDVPLPGDPAYFYTMQRAVTLEKQKQYEQAIALYRQALGQTADVAPSLVRQSKIASHNRLGACFQALGKLNDAKREYEESLKLGDQKYAQKALNSLLKQAN